MELTMAMEEIHPPNRWLSLSLLAANLSGVPRLIRIRVGVVNLINPDGRNWHSNSDKTSR